MQYILNKKVYTGKSTYRCSTGISDEAAGTVAGCWPPIVAADCSVQAGVGYAGIGVVLTPTGNRQTDSDYHTQQVSHVKGLHTLVITSQKPLCHQKLSITVPLQILTHTKNVSWIISHIPVKTCFQGKICPRVKPGSPLSVNSSHLW